MKSLLVFVFVVALAAIPAFADDQVASLSSPAVTVSPTRVSGCYTRDEAVAEQGIRIHSELMVIGLNCQHMTPAGQENLYQAYREFTARNSNLFAGYETRLLGYFQRTGSGNPEADLNQLRTALANKISLDAAKTRTDVFCQHYIPRIQKASAMDRGQLQHWAETFYPGHPTTHPVCTQ